jgi:hypothetical protein
MLLTLSMFVPFIATFALATWSSAPVETRSKDYQGRMGSPCQG